MFAIFQKSSYLAAYTVHSPATPNASSTHLPSLAASTSAQKTFNVGLWKVIPATHKTTGKEVSLWMLEKRVLDGIRAGTAFGGIPGKDWVIEQLKKEASALSRLRHPDILHMVEPLEDSRSEMTFMTERITSSLSSLAADAAATSGSYRSGRPPTGEDRGQGELDLDEVEIQKGTLQIARGLSFLHTQAKVVHLNLGLEAVVINAKGDWKLTGLSHTTPLSQPDGSATKYVFPEVDARLPPQVQWKLDYLAPEYALDNSLNQSNDLYSLGCILYAVHMGGKPPFKNRGSIQSLRENIENKLVTREWASGSRWDRCSSELKDLLPRLLTRHPSTRLSLPSLPSHPFFSSLAISTLSFLDPTTFASKPREEKATFLRGLVRVLPGFSERLRKGKVLLSLLEEMKDSYLLPFILPNVFEISKSLSKEEFNTVLVKLQPLFALKDPPQNMLTLLEHLTLFEEKTTPQAFRDNIMPLIYNSLESEHLPVQERALKTIPHLTTILDYATVQNVLLVKVAIVFRGTRVLSVKVQTLECFGAMVGTLDKATLTGKLVPLLAKIKTKEPAVMMATLAVHEAMGSKVDREAVATLVLPQLWSMSMGPLLNASQFAKFMAVIKTLGSRVEKEHAQHLKDVGRIEAQTASLAAANSAALNGGSGHNQGGEVDFETLVRGSNASPALGFDLNSTSTPVAASSTTITDPWDDESWLSQPSDAGLSSTFPSLSVNNTASTFPGLSAPASPKPPATNGVASLQPTKPIGAPKLKAKPVPAASFNSSAFAPPPSAPSTSTTLQPTSMSSLPPLQPTSSSFGTLQPQQASRTPSYTSTTAGSEGGGGPNYNISLSPQPPTQSSYQSSPLSFMTPQPAQATRPLQPSQPLQPAQPAMPTMQPVVSPPPGWSSGVMQPTSAPKPTWGKGAAASAASSDWGDFDPLK
ncbi:hypothetical protein L202_00269 [Cryptococcus amylolentus CBS 6039]|uniref:Protein kinase domain-containing protein n=1 Tax=Cryptococcus amylolentus CBS 6039 TaxID=1295533 RepID=A0A1E3I718_9TREE|nr:hypothetical protein L202_00269 [Cryptococcus amylolentus CBS 6039]ODN84288.1 hypothetical protein L202_00269 [Cryptococcus amylolentus CBS 6039]